MFAHHFDEKPGLKVVLHWFMLSFNGGFINAGGFLATGKFVSHVTGFATIFGADMMQEGVFAALGILSVPVFFLLGAFIAGLLIDRPVHLKKVPHFDYVMYLSATCLFLVCFGNRLNMGAFGDVFKLEQGYNLLGLLCLTCGLQNAAITSSSAKSVRSTHLTGLTTDLGLGLARLLTFHLKKENYQSESRANKLRVGSIFSFIFGSAVGSWVFLKLGYAGFFIPAVISLYAGWHGRIAKKIWVSKIK